MDPELIKDNVLRRVASEIRRKYFPR